MQQRNVILVGAAIIFGVITSLFIYNKGIGKDKEVIEIISEVVVAESKEVQPDYMYISELVSVRDSVGGIPGKSLIIGERVEVAGRDGSWLMIKTEDTTGWIEEDMAGDEKHSDMLIEVRIPGDDGYLVTKDVRDIYKLGDVQFAPIKKEEYPGNPRIENRAIYISLNRIGRLDDYIKLAGETDINTFVLDVKDDKGRILFDSATARETLGDNYIRERYKDIERIVAKLKENDIYLIGRISTFKDEALALSEDGNTIYDNRSKAPYKSRDGMPWLSPYSREVWHYNVEVAKEAADLGFNEISFDYVRFPSGVRRLEAQGVLDYRDEYTETKPESIQRFLKYARDELSKKEVYVNASVFGQVGISNTDENIGQYWEAVSNVVDVISPMAYPSHYALGTLGIRNPDKEPFKLMDRYAEKIAQRNSNLETAGDTNVWIQGFSAPWLNEYRVYREEELKEQIDALKKNNLDNYLVWNARSSYYWDGFKLDEEPEIRKK